jgi:hypothetical protein
MRIALPLIVSLGMLVTMISLSLGLGSMLPAQAFALSVMPLAALLATAIFAAGPRVVQRINAFPERYVLVWLAVIMLLAVGHGLIIRNALMAL